jgi:hypothetical protein
MPIKAEMRWFYPIGWLPLSNLLRFERAGGICSAAVAHMVRLFAAFRMAASTMPPAGRGAIIAAARPARPTSKKLFACARLA